MRCDAVDVGHLGVRETVDLDHIKRHLPATHRSIDPTGIVPVGPALDRVERPAT